MIKPEITRKLGWTAFWLEIGWIAVNTALVFLAYLLPAGTAPEYVREAEIPFSIPVVTAVGYCLMIPFAWSCLYNALRKEVSENQAMSGLILPPVLYVIGILLEWVLNQGRNIIASRMYSTEIYAAFMYKIQYQNLINLFPVQTAALVLICCASAIEVYILKHKES